MDVEMRLCQIVFIFSKNIILCYHFYKLAHILGTSERVSSPLSSSYSSSEELQIISIILRLCKVF